MGTETLTRPEAAPPPRVQARQELLPWVSLAGRLVLAGALGYAALTKIGNPQDTVRAVRAYKLLPEWVVVPFAHALPWFELGLALVLLVGLAVRLSGLLTTLLMTAFFVGIASAWARGLKIDCGCFGGGGPNPDPQYLTELLRDGGFLVASGAVAAIRRSRYALDPEPPAEPTHEGPVTSRRQRQQAALEAARWSAARRRHALTRWYVVAALVVLSLIGVVAGAAQTPGKPSTTPRGALATGGIVVGQASAPHLLVMYEDPQCPSCARFERRSGPVLDQAVAQGLVRVEYRMRSFIGHESVRAVAALGSAADAGRFDELRRQLYAHQPAESTDGYKVEDLVALGRTAGITSSSFERSVRTQQYAKWALRVDDLASKAGNVATPELLYDGRTVPPQVAYDPASLARLLGLG